MCALSGRFQRSICCRLRLSGKGRELEQSAGYGQAIERLLTSIDIHQLTLRKGKGARVHVGRLYIAIRVDGLPESKASIHHRVTIED